MKRQKKGYRYRLAVARYKEIDGRKWYKLFREWLALLKRDV